MGAATKAFLRLLAQYGQDSGWAPRWFFYPGDIEMFFHFANFSYRHLGIPNFVCVYVK